MREVDWVMSLILCQVEKPRLSLNDATVMRKVAREASATLCCSASAAETEECFPIYSPCEVMDIWRNQPTTNTLFHGEVDWI